MTYTHETEKSQLRYYRGQSFDKSHLSKLDFLCVFSTFKQDNSPYLQFFSGNRLIDELSYNDFYSKAVAFSQVLKNKYQLKTNDKVVVKIGNTTSCLVAYSAILLLGAVIVPIDPNASLPLLKFIIDDCKAALLISLVEHELDTPQLIFSPKLYESLVDDPVIDDLLVEDKLNKKPNRSFELKHHDTNCLSLIVYTSGTTGDAKAVCLSMANLIANADAVTEHHQLNPQHKHMCVLPLFHVNAFNLSFFASLYSKSQLLLCRSFYLPSFWQLLQQQQIKTVSVAPKIINLLLNDRRKHQLNTEFIDYFICASAPLLSHTANEFYQKFSIKILQGYGMSEAVNFSLTMPTDLSDIEYQHFLDEPVFPVGVEVGNHVFVLDEQDNELDENKVGEIAIQGFNVMQGYYHNEKASVSIFSNGYLHSGDLGFFKIKNNKKNFYLTGRLKEIIIKNGENISPLDLDKQINQLEGLEQAVIVGFKNSYTGEEIGLFVVANDQTKNEQQIIEQCLKLLPKKQCPKVIIFGNHIPVTATGKIQRLKLTHYFSDFEETYFK